MPQSLSRSAIEAIARLGEKIDSLGVENSYQKDKLSLVTAQLLETQAQLALLKSAADVYKAASGLNKLQSQNRYSLAGAMSKHTQAGASEMALDSAGSEQPVNFSN